MFNFIKNKFKKIYTHFTQTLGELFLRKTIDENSLKELELILINADTGVQTTQTIIQRIKAEYEQGKITGGSELKKALEAQLLSLLIASHHQKTSSVYLLVGINGSGKTTFASKLAHHFITEKKRVLLVAGDTFRAAAAQQLAVWAHQIGADVVIGKEHQDPASVVFMGCQKFKEENYDILIVDTAGRLQTKVNLMHELEKIKRTISKQLPAHSVSCLLTIDSMLGQNSFEQAKLFHDSTQLDGIVLTKMDGTGKGGIVFAISRELKIPISYVSFGESLNQFQPFDPYLYVRDLLYQ